MAQQLGIEILDLLKSENDGFTIAVRKAVRLTVESDCETETMHRWRWVMGHGTTLTQHHSGGRVINQWTVDYLPLFYNRRPRMLSNISVIARTKARFDMNAMQRALNSIVAHVSRVLTILFHSKQIYAYSSHLLSSRCQICNKSSNFRRMEKSIWVLGYDETG